MKHVKALTSALTLTILATASSWADDSRPATFNEFMQSPEATSGLAAEFNGNNYGFVITNRGAVRALHDASGNIIFDEIGAWVIQRNSVEHAGWASDPSCDVSVTEGNEGGTKTYTIDTTHPRMIQKMKIVCRESGPEIQLDWKIVDFSTGEGLNFPIALNTSNVEVSVPKPEANPIVFNTVAGAPISIIYSGNFVAYGTDDKGAYVPGSNRVSFYPKFSGSHDAGATDSLQIDIGMP